MLRTATIKQMPVTAPDVYAFRLQGEVAAADLQAMAETMNIAFDTHASVSMLLLFEDYDGVEAGAGLDVQTLSSQVRSLAKVERYAVVGAPRVAAAMITVMDKIIPTDARTFSADQVQEAWDFVGTRPTAET